MSELFECVGDPRAQGIAQGKHYRELLRGVLPKGKRRSPLSLAPLASGEVLGSRTGREVIRHYTHLAERMDGLATGAGISFASVMQSALESGAPSYGEDGALALPFEAVGSSIDGVEWIARGLPAARSEWVLRESRPDVGFASLEVTLPWLAQGVAGVNEHGVSAVLLTPGAAASGAPPASLLVQECLQRFRDLAGCFDWCAKRPAAHGARLLFGDSSGRLAVVVIGERSRVEEPADRVFAEAATPERSAFLEKWARQTGGSADAVLQLGREGVSVVTIDVGIRRVVLHGPGDAMVEASLPGA